MRVFKFRAWHKEKGWADEIAVFNDGSWSATYGNVSGYDAKDGVELTQFTGITNKEDKDIYEGDYVRYSPMEGAFGVVKWMNAMFFVISLDGTTAFTLHDEWQVVGNIYERPVLEEVKP